MKPASVCKRIVSSSSTTSVLSLRAFLTVHPFSHNSQRSDATSRTSSPRIRGVRIAVPSNSRSLRRSFAVASIPSTHVVKVQVLKDWNDLLKMLTKEDNETRSNGAKQNKAKQALSSEGAQCGARPGNDPRS